MIKNIKEFDKLTVADQVQFINKELEKDKNISVTKILKKYGLNKSTIISRFIENKYKYNIDTRQYIKNTDMIQDNKNNDIKNKSIKEVAVDKDIDTDIKELLKYKDNIIEIVKQYQSSRIVTDTTDMIIDTSIISDKTSNHNFKVYTMVLKEIQHLQKQYNHFKLTDLVSTALHQFYIKYKK